MVLRIFCYKLFLSLFLISDLYAQESVLLRYKPRLQEAVYAYYSNSQTLFTNDSYQKNVESNSQAYLGLRTMKTLENGHLVQRVGVHAGNVMMNGQVFAHPSLGKYLEYILAPWGAIPKAIGNSMQFKVRDLEMSFPKEPVSVGSSWTVTVPASITFPVKTEINYRVSSILGGLVILDAKLDIAEQKVVRNMNFTLKGSAQIIFNADEGLMVRNESNQFIEIKRAASGLERSTKMNVNSILELQF